MKIFKYTFLIMFFVFVIPVFSQTASIPWWLSLEYGKQRFRAGDYGDALILFEDARRDRRAMYEHMEKEFITFLSMHEVRRLNDHLDWVERYAKERLYSSITSSLEELYYRVDKASLKNSATAAIGTFRKLKDFPEAEYWIGEVYRVEGELPLALMQYNRAYDMRENLENPDFALTIKYNISSILRTRQDYAGMERTLQSIVAEYDTLWINAGRAEIHKLTHPATGRGSSPVPYEQAEANFTRNAMKKTIEKDGFNHFLVLYRYNNITVEQAHRLLGFHYVVTGRSSAQDHLMFAFLIQNSIIIEELRRRQYDFIYTDLQSLSKEINRIEILLSFIDEVEYYKTAYYLAASLFRNNNAAVARNIWEFLASEPQAGQWQGRAQEQLRNPRTETIITMP